MRIRSERPERKDGQNARGFRLLIIAFALMLLLLLGACGTEGEKTAQTTEPRLSEDVQKDHQEDTQKDARKETAGQETQPRKGEEAVLFFASDYQAVDGLPSPGENLTSVLRSASGEADGIEKVVLCGDYTNDRNLHDYQLSPDSAIEEIREAVRTVCPQISDEDMLFVQGNHDQMTDQISESGLHEYEDYLIYVLNTQEDFPWKQGKTSGSLDKVKAASAKMKTCFEELIKRGEKRPVLIAGHVPLHFTARTSSRHTTGDNLYSSLIFDQVNAAGKDLDIVYFFGHNHSKGWDCYLGGGSVYRGRGEKLLIPRFDEKDISTDRFSEETLNFTYLNAGYIGYYMNCGPEEYDSGRMEDYAAADGTMTGTLCRIGPDRIELSRFDAEGVHPLGADGEGDPYKGGIDQGLIGQEHYSQRTESPISIPRR